ncbi:MAG TPA: hypothetical protein VG942_03270, partial [Hyphomonadaceae bacterium]|nr:hypothetical protein [Hyphomonadaceae bacterium]
PSPEALLAKAIRTRMDVERSATAADYRLVGAKGAESCLREYVGRSNPNHHRDLIRALSNQLADAMDDRARVSRTFGLADPETARAEQVVLDLTAAINAEVHNTQG